MLTMFICCDSLHAASIAAAGQNPCSRITTCDGLQAALAYGCPSVTLSCKAVLPACYAITIAQSVNIGSTCSAASRPIIYGSGTALAAATQTPMFTIENLTPDTSMIFVSFTNVILSSHYVEAEAVPADPTSAADFARSARSAAIFSNTGGVSINLKAVTITAMNAGAGAVALYGVADTLQGNLTASASTITSNTGTYFQQAAGFTVKDSGTVRISATTFSSNKGTSPFQTYLANSALYIDTAASVTIDSSTFSRNVFNITKQDPDIVIGTAVIVKVSQIAVLATTFAENIGDPLLAAGDVGTGTDGPTATLLVKATTFAKNTGSFSGGLVMSSVTACISANTFSNNLAIGYAYNVEVDGVNQVDNIAVGALYARNAIVSGSANTFKLNRISPAAIVPNTLYWAHTMYIEVGASAVFTATTVDASGNTGIPDIVAGGDSALSFCKSTFQLTPKTRIPVTLASIGSSYDAAALDGTISVCPTTPYLVTDGIVTPDCTTCSAVGSTDCGKAKSSSAWLPWLNTIYPNYWQTGLGSRALDNKGKGGL